MSSTMEAGYNRHLWGREMASALHIPLLLLSSVGQYRVNLGLFRQDPAHSAFAREGAGSWYRPRGLVAKTVQRAFVPPELRAEPATPARLESLRRSGSGLQSFAGHGLQVPALFRLGINARTLFDAEFWSEAPGSKAVQAAVVSDTLGVGGGVVQAHFYNVALRHLRAGRESEAWIWFVRNHRLHLASGAFQMGAGLLRFGLEMERYASTGEFRPSHTFFAVLDTAAGGSGIWYSRHLLQQSRATSLLSARNDALMGLTRLPAGMRWGMRGLGLAGNAVGFGLSLHAFATAYDDEGLSPALRRRRLTSAGLGMAGSAMMMGSALLVCPASAPVAGLLMVGGLGLLVVQSAWFS